MTELSVMPTRPRPRLSRNEQLKQLLEHARSTLEITLRVFDDRGIENPPDGDAQGQAKLYVMPTRRKGKS
jgi:hypothetical protein